jgi:HSP20 family protein
LSFDSDFDDVFDDFDMFRKFVKKSQGEMDEVIKKIKSGAIRGVWEIREINEPGVKGYAIQGRFGTNETADPLEPLKPSKRRPLPRNPFEIPKTALKEMRQPLVDVFEENNAVKIYAELPGEEKDDIKVNAAGDKIEIKAKNFHRITELPDTNLAIEGMSSEYKNGVLEITIPKRKALREKDARRAKMV